MKKSVVKEGIEKGVVEGSMKKSDVKKGVGVASAICLKSNPHVTFESVFEGGSGMEEGQSVEEVVLKSCGTNIRCGPCEKDVPNSPAIIHAHNISTGHKRFLELSLKKEILRRWNIDRAPVGRAFVCLHCNVHLDCSFTKLEKHFMDFHMLPFVAEPKLDVFKAFKRKKFYESNVYDFDAEKESFRILQGGFLLSEAAGNYVGLMKLDVVPKVFSSKLYEIALELESGGCEIQRGSKKEGTKMEMFGNYYRGSPGW